MFEYKIWFNLFAAVFEIFDVRVHQPVHYLFTIIFISLVVDSFSRASLSRSQSRDQQVLLEQTIGNVHVTVMAADITTIKADVIVNASNETLHHIGK